MEKIERGIVANRRRGRRWRFASAEFDEGTWVLAVDGCPAQIEGKPLELLHELLLHAGEVVTKDELLAAVWPNVSVVEASLTTAVLKLRRALGDQGGEQAIIETAPRIGYRLKAAVEMEFASPRFGDGSEVADLAQAAQRDHRRAAQTGRSLGWVLAAAGLAATLAAGAAFAPWPSREPPKPVATFSQQEARDALRKIDVARIEEMLRAGWDPNKPFDNEGNGAVNILLNNCEWDPGHDRRKLLLMARTLFDGGARLEARNIWGDTAYSIAKAPRYCGPNHPVTQMLHAMCYNGFRPVGDKCLAVYPPKPVRE